MKKEPAQLYLVATDKPSQLGLHGGILHMLSEVDSKGIIGDMHWEYCNIYITNDEPVKEGDWFIHRVEQIPRKCTSTLHNPSSSRKIVATTNPDLLNLCSKCGEDRGNFVGRSCDKCFNHSELPLIPKISNIEGLVKAWNEGVHEVMLEYEVVGYLAPTDMYNGEVKKGQNFSIKKASPNKEEWSIPYQIVESWEPKLELKLTPNGEVIWSLVEEKMYTRDEVRTILIQYNHHNSNNPDYKAVEWFNKNYPQ